MSVNETDTSDRVNWYRYSANFLAYFTLLVNLENALIEGHTASVERVQAAIDSWRE